MNYATKRMKEIIAIKKLMDEAIDKLGTDSDYELYESEFKITFKHCNVSKSVKSDVIVEIWELFEKLVNDYAEIFMSEDYGDIQPDVFKDYYKTFKA